MYTYANENSALKKRAIQYITYLPEIDHHALVVVVVLVLIFSVRLWRLVGRDPIATKIYVGITTMKNTLLLLGQFDEFFAL